MGAYRKLMDLPGGKIFLKKDEIWILDYNDNVKVKIDWYPYEDGYCITLWKDISGTFSNFCNFKGTIKFENKKILLIDFYQFPPIQPAIITYNNYNRNLLQKRHEKLLRMPTQKQKIHQLHTRHIRTRQKATEKPQQNHVIPKF